ncbi:MAG: GPW/gp25 family protein [Planctomycetes bacterium]|nr:GPW/gp25 family protein [Planctomycetota bacterium]
MASPSGYDTRKSFLGVGWKFPVDLDRRRGIAMSQFEENIEESILVILGTSLGERLMRPDFGCAVHDLVFAPNNSNTHGLVIYYVTEALNKWEPRIQALKVDCDVDPQALNKVDTKIEYQVIATNNVYNLVYPFYLQKSP